MAYRDLREYLSALERAGKLRRIRRPINKDTELHPLVRWQYRGLQEPERAGFLFESVTDLSGRSYDGAVASSVLAASREIYGLAMGCQANEVPERWVQAHQNPIQPILVKTGSAKEEIHKGDTLLQHKGLEEFPVPMATNGWEALPRMTAVSWFSKDPETGQLNIGTYNGLLFGPLRTNCRAGISSHMYIHWLKCRERGIPLQVAGVVGAPPAVCLSSVNKIPYGVSELAIAGGVAGEAIPVVRCETVDLEVPAHAEIVFEGEIPTDHTELDGASGEHTGYTMIDTRVLAFHVRCITHRKNPIWHDFACQLPPSESSTIRALAMEGLMLNFLRRDCGIPQVKDVAFFDCAGATRICVIRMRDVGGIRTHNSTVWQALTAALSKGADWPKLVIAVDEDIDPHDFESVLWAVSFRYQPHRDTRIIPGRGASLDQSSAPYTQPSEERRYPKNLAGPEGASAILIDATRKWDYTPVSLPKREYMERAREIWEELGLPKLTPKSPWFGYNLGVWPEKYEAMAKLGASGDYAEVVRILTGEEP